MLLDQDGEFYFLEVNARLQVEHPVTELVTGIDLVHWQLRVAAGEPLDFRQEDVTLRGHAVECRIQAEDPCNQFFPSTGPDRRRPRAERARRPDRRRAEAGLDVTPLYDSLLAKLIVWAEDRPPRWNGCTARSASTRCSACGRRCPFHRWLMRHPPFVAGELRHRDRQLATGRHRTSCPDEVAEPRGDPGRARRTIRRSHARPVATSTAAAEDRWLSFARRAGLRVP